MVVINTPVLFASSVMNSAGRTGVFVWVIKSMMECKKLLTIIRLAGKIVTVANERRTAIN